MTRRLLLQNNTSDSLSASCLAADTTISVANGAKFPAAGEFVILVESELMLCTSRSGNVLTVVRGQEGTTAAAHGSGLAVVMTYSAYCVQRYGRDNDPGFDCSRPPFRLLDASGNVLTSADFTTTNLSTSTITDDSSGSISIRKAAQGATEDFTLLSRAAPATPYSLTAAMTLGWPMASTSATSCAGVGFLESGTGKFIVATLINSSGGPCLRILNYTNATTFSANTLAVTGPVTFIGPAAIWWKLTDDGTNLTFAVSHDGEHWMTLITVSRTAFMTSGPDKIIFGGNNRSNTLESVQTLVAWQE